MSVTAILRSAVRAENRHVVTHIIPKRALSGAEAVNALRPFYFAVHPDFFGQHPKEREVNENSLKRLNGYLESLQKPGGRPVRPTRLTFYVRETQAQGDEERKAAGFRPVTFTLQTRDVLSTVVDVLRSCSLSVEHVQALQSGSGSGAAAARPFYRPIKWDKTYYAFTGFRDPEQELEQARRVEPALSVWLRDNEAGASQKQSASLPRREELERLKTELREKLGLGDIRWQRCWDVSHRCCQLQSLARLSLQNPEALLNLRGHTILYSDQSGMNASGYVMLGNTDVHHHWARLFERLPSYCGLFQQTECLKEQISLLLGGVQVVHVERLGPVLPLEEHYAALSAFQNRLLPQRLVLHPRSLQGLTMTLENDRTRPSLHELGHFIIPTASDPAQLRSFLQSRAQEARKRMKSRKELEAEEQAVVERCVRRLSLSVLTKEPSVSSSQMIQCCRRLLDECSPHVQGLRLRVSHFYSVVQDGDLCIPWDWKS
ncbi:T-cell activation inhibitor, mitochondrial isoform X2 [Denticeps clupeoides]|uniref:T-cell activation inhibitor, mitochondrial n=1 Tax=Denticeps clupeoides TaxID=299321 RepID=A0A8C3YXN5_9TELE|nr:T-cell activation inhibitor, mitochondrial isoform X2 [Denticeps clupeoides]